MSLGEMGLNSGGEEGAERRKQGLSGWVLGGQPSGLGPGGGWLWRPDSPEINPADEGRHVDQGP